jgi:hypothetical protein
MNLGAITAKIQPINRVLRPGTLYKHYKGNIYKINMVAKHTETNEDLVIYHMIDKPEQIWARPLFMFNESVIVDSKMVLRFTSV